MAELTEPELLRFRRKIGDGGTPPAFGDEELQDLYAEAGDDFTIAIRDAYDELIGSAWRFNDYTQNETQDKKQQIFQNLLKAREIWQAKVDKAEAATRASNQVRIVGLQSMPPRVKRKPADLADDDEDTWTLTTF